jgi:hypothetical protein
LTPNFGSWAGRLHAVLGAACGTSALPADLSPNLQSTNRARIRLSTVYSLTAFIRLHDVLGAFIGHATPAPADSLSNFYKHHSPHGEDLHWGMSIFDIERIVLVQ